MKLLRELILKNWTLKVTALLLAFFLWAAVRGDRDAKRVINIPLEIRIPRNMEIVSERPNFVEVTVHGALGNLWIGQSAPSYSIDLQAASEGEHIVPLTSENVRIPRAAGIEVIKVSPARITLVLERTISKEVPVVLPPPRGRQASGMDVYRITHWPVSVLITGPRSRIEPVREIATEPVSIEGLDQSLRTFANLVVRDNFIRTTPVGPVEVNIQIGTHREVRRINRVPILADNAGFRISPREITVFVLVPVTVKKSLTADDVVATLPLGGIDPSVNTVKLKPEVSLKNPPDPAIAIRDFRPSEITIQRIRNR